MELIIFCKLTGQNFDTNSLDEFVRHQEVKECWRRVNNELVLVENNYVEDWDLEKRREKAKEIASGINDTGFGYGAFVERKVVGYIYISKKFFWK